MGGRLTGIFHVAAAYRNSNNLDHDKQNIVALVDEIERHARIKDAAKALLEDVRRRYPGEELRCPYMRTLDEACSA